MYSASSKRCQLNPKGRNHLAPCKRSRYEIKIMTWAEVKFRVRLHSRASFVSLADGVHGGLS